MQIGEEHLHLRVHPARASPCQSHGCEAAMVLTTLANDCEQLVMLLKWFPSIGKIFLTISLGEKERI